MPRINLKSGVKSWAQRPKVPQVAWSDNTDFYNGTAWRRCRESYHNSIKGLCEVSRHEKKYHAAKEIDHIIPVRLGGAKYDHRNLMGMTQYYHRRKTRLERDKEHPLVDWIETDNGLIPKRKEDIIHVILR